jgi:hypothetical protein
LRNKRIRKDIPQATAGCLFCLFFGVFFQFGFDFAEAFVLAEKFENPPPELIEPQLADISLVRFPSKRIGNPIDNGGRVRAGRILIGVNSEFFDFPLADKYFLKPASA